MVRPLALEGSEAVVIRAECATIAGAAACYKHVTRTVDHHLSYWTHFDSLGAKMQEIEAAKSKSSVAAVLPDETQWRQFLAEEAKGLGDVE